MKKWFVFFMCFIYTGMVFAACPNNKPYIRLTASKGTVKYITNMARKDFIAKYPGTPDTTLGLTVAELKVNMQGTSSVSQNMMTF